MTSTLPPRTRTARPAAAPPAEPGALAPGLLAAGWAAGAGLVAVAVPVLLAWATDARSTSPAGTAIRTAGQVWLLGQGVALHTPAGLVGLTPLGLLGLPLLLLHRAGRYAVRTSTTGAARLVGAIAVPYGVLVLLVALLSRDAGTHPSVVRALLCGLLVGAVGGGAGVLRESGDGGRLWARVPARWRHLVVSAGAGLGVLAAGGALLTLSSLLVHHGRLTTLFGAGDPGFVGSVVVLLLCLAILPNAVLWGASWLVGPGFAVGAATHVGPFGTSLGAVPAFPLLAGLPTGPPPTALVLLAALVPLTAGVAAGRVLDRRTALGSWRDGAAEGLLVGAVAGVLAAVAALVSGGPLGGHRLAAVGPSAWQVGLAVLVAVGVPAAVTCAAGPVVRRRRS